MSTSLPNTTSSSSTRTTKADTDDNTDTRRSTPQVTHRGQGFATHLPTNPKPSETLVPMSTEPLLSETAAENGTDEDCEIIRRRDLSADGKLDAILLLQKERKEREAENEARNIIFDENLRKKW